jgi:hypothetical protein
MRYKEKIKYAIKQVVGPGVISCIKRNIYELGSFIRVQKPVTIFMGPAFRPTFDKIGLDITYLCNLKCIGCHKSLGLCPSNENLSVEQIEKFINESITQSRKWKLIRILGGEPTLHPQIMDIIDLLVAYKRKHSPATILRVDTNGHDPKVNSILSAMSNEITFYNTRKKNSKQTQHEAFFCAPVDRLVYRFSDFSNGCAWPFSCGITLSPYGYYFCGAAIGIERIFGFNLGRKELPLPHDEMREQYRIFCKYCGHFMRFSHEKKYPYRMSATWKKAYERTIKQV